MLIGHRIKSARIMAGYSLRELSKALNGIISHTAISKYEKGVLMPDSKVLILLSKALNVKTDYFLRPQTVEISNIEFRKKSNLSSKKTNAIKENMKDNIERYLELETFLNLHNTFNNPIRQVLIKNAEDIEKAVVQLLHQWDLGLNALPNVLEILEDHDIKIVEIDADEKFDGLSGWASQEIPVIVINKNFTVERRRFTALHELGHLLLNFQNGIFNPNKIEEFCNHFAAAVLLPKITLFNELGEKRHSISINELVYIKESYGISIQAIMARAKGLDIISSDQFRKFKKWINSNESRQKEIGFGDYKGIEHSSRFKQLLYRATAEEIISISKAASLSNVKLAQFRDEFMTI